MAVWAKNPKPAPDGLDTGELIQAVNDVRAREGLDSLGAAPEESTPRGAPEAEAPAPRFDFSIVARGEVRVGSPVTFFVQPATPTGVRRVGARLPDDAVITWHINGTLQPPVGQHGVGCTYTPEASERELVVSAAVASAAAGAPSETERMRSFVVRRRQEHEDAETLEAEAQTIEFGQTMLWGSLIAFFGYAIFHDSFVGSLENVVAAFAWGFATDVTVNSALALAQPLTKKKLPAAQ